MLQGAGFLAVSQAGKGLADEPLCQGNGEISSRPLQPELLGQMTEYGGVLMIVCCACAGDPIFTGFAGRSFEFMGLPGHFYNVMSERNHQISAKLKVGVMWDHNGTYMEGIGFHYRSHKVVIELSADSITGESALGAVFSFLDAFATCMAQQYSAMAGSRH
jgi:hypothetical protein